MSDFDSPFGQLYDVLSFVLPVPFDMSEAKVSSLVEFWTQRFSVDLMDAISEVNLLHECCSDIVKMWSLSSFGGMWWPPQCGDHKSATFLPRFHECRITLHCCTNSKVLLDRFFSELYFTWR